MRRRNYTPGPWFVATGCSWRRILNDEQKEVIIPTNSRADGHPDLRGGCDGKGQANMTLAAAAPELLEALEPFANYACSDWMTHQHCHNCAAKRAIAKAHGDSV